MKEILAGALVMLVTVWVGGWVWGWKRRREEKRAALSPTWLVEHSKWK